MKANRYVQISGWVSRFATTAICLSVFLGLEGTFPEPASAGGTVTICTESDLRGAMAGGGTVTFACDGTLTLANTVSNTADVVLDGSGHQITISGNNSVRVFQVATNVSLTLVNLTVANGRSFDGAGVLNNGGKLVFRAANFLSNIVTSGALFGTNAASCGGAICNRGGTVTLSNCVFIGNQALGSPSDSHPGSGIAGGDGCGGAIYSAGQLSVERSTFDGNGAQGGAGASGGGSSPYIAYAGAGGSANGGAIFVLGSASVSGSTFVRNAAVGGGGGWGGDGISSMIAGFPGGWGGAGGAGNGAALFIGGTVSLVNCTIAGNTAAGAAGGHGGIGGFGGYGGSGGYGGAGGAGFGGLCDAGGLAAITNCTVAFNVSVGGAGGAGAGGGFGPYGNGSSGAPGTAGIAAGGLRTVGGKLLNTLLAENIPTNCSGAIIDLGHNLSSDVSCVFTNTGTLNNTDPKLAALADNGGPTPTMALLPESPAIDAGDTTGAPTTDQRGRPRPTGAAADIGAYEYGSTPRLRLRPPQDGTIEILLSDVIGRSCRLLTTTDFATWHPIATNQIGADGTALFKVNAGSDDPHRFYRVALP